MKKYAALLVGIVLAWVMIVAGPALAGSDGTAHTLVKQGYQALTKGDYARALSLLNKAVQAKPNHALARAYRCYALLQLGRARPAVAACTRKMRATWDALPGLPFQKATLWGLYHRGRYHVGPYAWRMARHAWPIMPYVDRAMIETGLGMPLGYLEERRMQIDILKRDYGRLAALPVDRNLPETPALIEPWHDLARRLLRRVLNKVLPELFGRVALWSAAGGFVMLLFFKPIKKLMGGVR